MRSKELQHKDEGDDDDVDDIRRSTDDHGHAGEPIGTRAKSRQRWQSRSSRGAGSHNGSLSLSLSLSLHNITLKTTCLLVYISIPGRIT